MKDLLRIWRIGLYVFMSIAILGSSVFSVRAQDEILPQGNRAVASLAIVNVEGDAQILTKVELERSRGAARILTDAWKPAIPRTPLSPGDQLRTGARGTLQLQLNDGTLVELGGDTVVVVEELRSSRGETPQTTQIKLEQGKISTQQMTKILGQTNQIIRTDNGTINTSLGEVEVWKPSTELPEVAMAGGLPLLAQKAPKDETHVMLNRGGTTLKSSGVGRLIASSITAPETCIDTDGLQLTLREVNEEVTITKLEDEQAYLLTSPKQFYVLVATEGTANIVEIITQDSAADIDIEGIHVAEQDPNGLVHMNLHPLLTVGIQTYSAKIKFGCDDATPRGLNDVSIQGDATVTPGGFGMNTDRPRPSVGSSSGPIPLTPTPTPTQPGGVDTDLRLKFRQDVASCGPIIDFRLAVGNIGEQLNAENVVITYQVIQGNEFVQSIAPTAWNVGTIAPGTSQADTVRIQTNDLWIAAAAGTLIRLAATVTNETSRPDQTVGTRATVTAINPGNCAAAPEGAEEEEAPLAAAAPSLIPVTHTHSRNPTVTGIAVDPGQQPHPLCADPLEYYIQFRVLYENYLPTIMGGQLLFEVAGPPGAGYSPNYKAIPAGLILPMNYSYSPNQQLESGDLETYMCYIPLSASNPALDFRVTVFDMEPNASAPFSCHIVDVAAGGTCP